MSPRNTPGMRASRTAQHIVQVAIIQPSPRQEHSQPPEEIQDCTAGHPTPEHIIPLAGIPEYIGPYAAGCSVYVPIVREGDSYQVPPGRGRAGREAADDSDGRQEQEDIAHLEGERQSLARKVILFIEDVIWNLRRIVIERVLVAHDPGPDSEIRDD
ncbi:hypothetical protein OPQ81_003777 [Rhizoctonia solani]|nr:hypothetical protein OPQ81_003777 [Rhizoctonia solani]